METILSMLNAVSDLLTRIGLGPAEFLYLMQALAAVVVGLGTSWMLTERIKRWQHWRGWKPRALAILIGFLATFTVWPGNGWLPFWAGFLVGVGAPIFYDLAVEWAAVRWGWVRRALGQS